MTARDLGLLAASLVLAACGAAVGPSPSPTQVSPTPTPVPGASGNLDGGNVGGGNVGGGVQPPCCKEPGDPNLGQAQLVVPVPGQLDLHPAGVALIRSAVDGHHLSVELRWWSGIAPCTVLDSVTVDRSGTTFTLTPLEGSSQRDVACDAIAQLKATVVDLGELDPGAYTIKAFGDPPAIEVTIS
jgi:hypothetical protein